MQVNYSLVCQAPRRLKSPLHRNSCVLLFLRLRALRCKTYGLEGRVAQDTTLKRSQPFLKRFCLLRKAIT